MDETILRMANMEIASSMRARWHILPENLNICRNSWGVAEEVCDRFVCQHLGHTRRISVASGTTYLLMFCCIMLWYWVMNSADDSPDMALAISNIMTLLK